MPRLSRKDLNSNFFHVIAQGINKEYIFKNEQYINEYKKLLKKYSKEDNVNILAYCIMNNHVHLLIYVENTLSMSKFMQHTNSKYGNYYNYKENRVGFVFRNRFLSEPIFDKNYLLNCIVYIHNNPVKARMVLNAKDYMFSSCRFYECYENDCLISNAILGKIFSDLYFDCKEKIYFFMDIDNKIEEMLNEIINDFLIYYNITEKILISNKHYLRKLLSFIKEKSNIKIPNYLIAQCLKINVKTIYRLKDKS